MSEQQQTPLTYERILELFHETREQFRETREQFQETREQFRLTDLRLAQQFQETAQETDRERKEFAREWRQQIQESERERIEFAREWRQRSQELDRKIQETWAQIKQTNKDVGGLTSSIGAIVANMVKGNIVEKFEALGYHDLDDCCEKKKFKNKKLKIKGEIDLFLENGSIAILIEVKTTLETKDVRDHIERLEKFRRYIDARGDDKRQFIGAVAGASVDDEVADFALESGMYVIVQSGEAVEIVPTPEGFQARKW